MRRDVPLPEARIDLAVRIDDVREQLGAAVRAHAVQRRPDLALAERRPACGSVEQAPVKSALPFAASPGFSISGSQRRDDVALRLAGRAERVEQRGRLLRDLPVRMRAQPRDVGGAETGRRDLAVLHRGEQRERRLRAPQDLIERRRRVRSRQRGDQHGIHVGARRSRRAWRSSRP